MALSSQTARSDLGRRPYGGGRRRRGRGPFGTRLFGLLLLVLIVFGAWWMWRPGPAEVGAEPETQAEPMQAGTKTPVQSPKTFTKQLPEPKTARRQTTSAARPQRTTQESNTPNVITMGEKLPEPAADEPVQTQLSSASPTTTSPARSTQPRTTTGAPTSRTSFGGELSALLNQAKQAKNSNRPAEARELFNRVLHDPRTDEAQRAVIRAAMTDLNSELVFGTAIAPNDPFVEKYSVQSGDNLVTIARAQTQGVDWRFIQRINRITDPGRLRVGQPLKVVKGPFHAIVDKSDFRVDLYMGPTPTVSGGKVVLSGADGDTPTYVCSFDVGLGEYGSTPVGRWIVNSSRTMNPSWKNPRTGEYFGADDPLNPIGERWVGLDGVDPETELLTGYGLHGTIDPDSIGEERSMGCVRLGAADIEVVYEVLGPQLSYVEVVD